MAHSRTIDETVPLDDDKEGLGAQELRNLKEDLLERLTLDHYMDAVLDTTTGTADGYHRQVTLGKQGTAPVHVADTGRVYTKDISSKMELFYKNNAGTEVQITSDNGLAFTQSFNSACFIQATSCSAGIVQFNIKIYDLNNEFAIVSPYKFTPLRAGIYLVNASVTDAVTLSIYKNGASQVSATSQVFGFIQCAIGDYIQINSSGSVTGANSMLSIGRVL